MTANNSDATSAARFDAEDFTLIYETRFDIQLELHSRDRKFGKRERTRLALMASVTKHLLDEPARNPMIESILDETGLSRGTFYNCFQDMDSAVEAVLSTFFQALWSYRTRRVDRPTGGRALDPIYAANLWYCEAYEINAGLFAAYTRVATYTPTLLRMREEINANWVDRVVAASTKRNSQLNACQRQALRGAVRLLVAMSIEALRERYVHRDALLIGSFPSTSAMAAGLTEIWHGTITLHERSAANSQ